MAGALVLLSLLALSLHRGDAIKCYVCSSAQHESCKDKFESTRQEHNLVTCTSEAMRNTDVLAGVFSSQGYHSAQPEDFACVKAVIREHEREVVIRSCHTPRTDTFDVCSQLKSRGLSFCGSCTHDGCNDARALAPGALLGALALALLATAYSRVL